VRLLALSFPFLILAIDIPTSVILSSIDYTVLTASFKIGWTCGSPLFGPIWISRSCWSIGTAFAITGHLDSSLAIALTFLWIPDSTLLSSYVSALLSLG
jgi:hypothetical protein